MAAYSSTRPTHVACRAHVAASMSRGARLHAARVGDHVATAAGSEFWHGGYMELLDALEACERGFAVRLLDLRMNRLPRA